MVTKGPSREKAAFTRTLKSARFGLIEAQYEVGLMYANGLGVEQDFEKALGWIRQAAERGYTPAQYLLATRYASGIAIERNTHMAFHWFMKAADRGHTKASYRLGKLYAAAQPEAAAICLERAASEGLAEAQYALAQAYARGKFGEKDLALALRWNLSAADQDYAPAQCALGAAYAHGLGVGKDVAVAMDWYRKAAKHFYPPALVAMNQLDEQGHGRSREKSRAKRKHGGQERRRSDEGWVKAAESGDADARYHLGLMYEGGIGVAQDAEQAQAWFVRAANQDDVRAQLALGRSYEAEYPDVAQQWFEKAAQLGSADAMAELGRAFSDQRKPAEQRLQGAAWYVKAAVAESAQAQLALGELFTVEQAVLAFACFKQAANQGDMQAQWRLSQCYASGAGVGQSVQLAFTWAKRAAEQGLAAAQSAVGAYYLEGYGTQADPVQALLWLEKAALQGDAKAQWNMGAVFASGAAGVEKDLRQAFIRCHQAAESGFVPAQATLGLLYVRIKEDDKALVWWTKAAEQGDPEAQYNLAIGLSKVKNLNAQGQAHMFRWFSEAANQGVGSAQVRLGLMYATGKAVPLDLVEAHKWFLIAKAAGDEAGRINSERSLQQLNAEQAVEAQRRVNAWVSARSNVLALKNRLHGL